MKLLHTADWHLDAPFGGLSGEQREALRQQLRQIPEKIAGLARQEGCDLILIAGDVFDGPYTRESLEAVKNALGGCGLPVFISPGNHDFISPDSPWLRESWPENVRIFTGGLQSIALPELDCRVWGAGYRSMDCPPLLEGFTAQGQERWQLGLLHGDPGSASSPYCPVTPAQIRASGLSYLALGHIHKAGSLTAGDTLCAWPGCPMGRGFDETGEKGVYILELGQQPRFVALDAPRFFDLEVDTGADAAAALAAVLPAAAGEDVYRLTLVGSGEGSVEDLAAEFAHVPNLILRDARQAPVDLWATAGQDSLEGVYFDLLRQLTQGEDPALAASAKLAAELSRRLLDGREVAL